MGRERQFQRPTTEGTWMRKLKNRLAIVSIIGLAIAER